MPLVRFRVYCIVAVSALLGTAAGAFGFLHLMQLESASHFLASLPGMHALGVKQATGKYSGTLIAHDALNKRVVINVANSFPQSAAITRAMEFRYDEATQWFSVEYIFKDGVLEKRRFVPDNLRDFPEGTLISVAQDYDGRVWRTVSIAFLRRTNI